jgi:transcriptional repressor NrdR
MIRCGPATSGELASVSAHVVAGDRQMRGLGGCARTSCRHLLTVGGGPAPGSFPGVRCAACGHLDSKVVDSRQSDDGGAIRRRRQCLACGRRFTTFERPEALTLLVIKRSGDRQPFDRSKVVAGVQAAVKSRPVGHGDAEALAAAVEDEMRGLPSPEVTSERVGRAVLERLREVDVIAAVRFASVYKGFDDLSDFEREVTLLTKRTAPKTR